MKSILRVPSAIKKRGSVAGTLFVMTVRMRNSIRKCLILNNIVQLRLYVF